MHRPDRRPYPWGILFLLWLLYMIFGMVARSIAPLVSPILADLAMTYSQMGIVLGSWQLTYILAALFAGTILDRWGVRKSILAGAMIIGLSAGLRYFADSFIVLLLTVSLFGVGGPMISIGGPKTISERFDTQSRGSAVGIYTTGPWIGGLLALSLTNSLIMPLMGNSWRLTFVCYGLVALFAALLWWFRSGDIQSSSSTSQMPINDIFRALINIRTVRILLAMSLFSFAIAHGFSNWLPKILETKGMTSSAAGLAAAIPLAAGIPAVLLIPRWVPPRMRGQVIAGCALMTIVNLMVVINASGPLLLCFLGIMGIFNSPFMPLMLLILMDSPEVDAEYMGSAGGMFFGVAEIGGFSGPLIMGILVDITGTFFAGVMFLVSL
ncbi:MAG: MFS transporter, partial [Desulfobacterales bacterium]